MGSRLVSVTKKTKKALLSISDGRASSFFNTFIKIMKTKIPFRDRKQMTMKEKIANPLSIEEALCKAFS